MAIWRPILFQLLNQHYCVKLYFNQEIQPRCGSIRTHTYIRVFCRYLWEFSLKNILARIIRSWQCCHLLVGEKYFDLQLHNWARNTRKILGAMPLAMLLTKSQQHCQYQIIRANIPDKICCRTLVVHNSKFHRKLSR